MDLHPEQKCPFLLESSFVDYRSDLEVSLSSYLRQGAELHNKAQSKEFCIAKRKEKEETFLLYLASRKITVVCVSRLYK